MADKVICGVCLNYNNNIDYYLCESSPICRDCLKYFLDNKRDSCPLCEPNKKCPYKIDNYDITSYPSPTKS
jgi:hypothetical protein